MESLILARWSTILALSLGSALLLRRAGEGSPARGPARRLPFLEDRRGHPGAPV